jgi:hypothetical protein
MLQNITLSLISETGVTSVFYGQNEFVAKQA